MIDYYKVLNVERTANIDEIKSTYKKLALKYHPDKNPNQSPSDLELFKTIVEAHTVLSDETSKKEYDIKLNNHNSFKSFTNIFSKGKQRPTYTDEPVKKPSHKGEDLKITLKVKLEDIYIGTKKTINYRRQIHCQLCSSTGAKKLKRCSDCGGRGVRLILNNDSSDSFRELYKTIVCDSCKGSKVEVDIPCNLCMGLGTIVKDETITVDVPVGIMDGETIKIEYKGNAAKFDGIPGNLWITIEEHNTDKLFRNGLDIEMEYMIPFLDMVLGGTVDIKLFTHSYQMKVPAGTNSGTIFRIKEGGIRKDGESGNLYIRLLPSIPQNLTDEQEALFQKLRNIENSLTL